MERKAIVERETKETRIRMELNLDGAGKNKISTGIPFFDHMLTLFSVHGFFDVTIDATGDIDVDFHHTLEDVGLVLGDAFDKALGDRKGIKRFGHAVTPMDDALSCVAAPNSRYGGEQFHVSYKGVFKGVFKSGRNESTYKCSLRRK